MLLSDNLKISSTSTLGHFGVIWLCSNYYFSMSFNHSCDNGTGIWNGWKEDGI